MKYALIIISLFVLAGCVKSESPAPSTTTPNKDTILTTEKLIGKWEVYTVSVSTYEDGELYETKSWTKSQGYYLNGNGPITRGWNDSTDISYITFTQDGRFVHTKPDGTPDSYMLRNILPKEGKWTMKSEAIGLTTYIDSTDLDYQYDFEDNEIVFNALETEKVSGDIIQYVTTFSIVKQ